MTGHENDFSYGEPAGRGSGGLSVSIFANKAAVREEMREDAQDAGFAVREAASLARLFEDDPQNLGEVVLVDCPEVSERGADALHRLDAQAARSGRRMVLSTTLDALDAVYAACPASEPQILVNSTRAGRVIVLGMILAEGEGGAAVRELTEGDRLTLLRLTEQVGVLAARIDRFGEGGPGLVPFGEAPPPAAGNGGAGPQRTGRPALPDPRLVRRLIARRQARARFFDGELFADPAWDMLLDLTAARAEHARVSVTSLCIAAGVPATTALRWISQLTRVGLFERVEDEADRRRAFIALSDTAAEAMARYFAELESDAGTLM